MDLDIAIETKEKVRNPTIKLNKKLAIAIAALTKSEKKPFDQLVTQEPTNKLIAVHFGVGDQDDYDTICNYVKQFGQNKIMIYPVRNYAFIEFQNIQQSLQLTQSLQIFENIKFANLKYQNKERATMFFYTKEQELIGGGMCDIPNAMRQVNIPGLYLIHDFITPEYEKYILDLIDKQEWSKLKQRRVQHYGYEFIYGDNTVNINQPADKHIPAFLEDVRAKVSDLIKPQPEINQLTVNEYLPGMGIPPHFDVHPPFHEKFVSISLLSGLVMSFKSFKGEEYHLYLPPRSCALFTGEVRYAWFHSIAARKIDKVEGETHFRSKRLSLTFRTIRNDLKCDCEYQFFCESQGYNPLTMKNKNPLLQEYLAKLNQIGIIQDNKVVPNKTQEEIQLLEEQQQQLLQIPKATEVEKKYVYEIYDKIAPHFSSTRYKPWPKIEQFLKSLEPGSLVADVGCGNGKYLGSNPDIEIVGTDRSENLLKICKEKSDAYQVFSADSLRLPLKSEMFDAVISIAVIHHFSNKILRQQAIKELLRICKSKGLVLIYVWAMEQEEKTFNEQDVFVPWNLQFKYEDEKVINQEVQQQFKIDDQKKTVVYKRYYHVFKQGEIEELLSEMPGFKIVNNYYDHANWVVVLQKD
ncbi:unnamed protein product [Paramecium octaurelia]|uniref:Fe2OG dioxygenase domain-containing protein n=1 Tax=Paramecium octaurelia TaxID=43137 RepID=A0A8S1T8R1_PAROT|nr:unnamed protein product [Paramecium octaurelia]